MSDAQLTGPDVCNLGQMQGHEMVDFAGSHVVVTGGTGTLGRAVVGALRAAGAVCHVPNLVAAELDDFPYSSDPGVHVGRGVDLEDEAAVRRFYQALRRSGRRFTSPAVLRWRPSARCPQQISWRSSG